MRMSGSICVCWMLKLIIHDATTFQQLKNVASWLEMIIDAWYCVESNRLQFQRSNQLKLRIDLYSGLQDVMGGGVEDNVQRLRRQIILASLFISGPRYMRQQYQDM